MWEWHLVIPAPGRELGLRARVEAGVGGLLPGGNGWGSAVEQPRSSWACGLGGSLAGASRRSPQPGSAAGSCLPSREGHGLDLAAASPGPRVSGPAHR